MDNKTLVITVVAAIIGAFVKEITSWLLSLGKNSPTTAKLITKAKQQFTLNKITVLFNFLFILYLIWSLYQILSDTSPIDRSVVFHIALFIGLIILSIIRIESVAYQYSLKQNITLETNIKLIEVMQSLTTIEIPAELAEKTRQVLGENKKLKTKAEVLVKTPDA